MASCCRLQLQLPGKPDKSVVRGARGPRGARLWPLPAGAAACDQRSAVSRRSGRPAFFTAVFSTFTPAVKDSWVNSLQMAQLALGRPARPHGRSWSGST